MAAIVMLVLNLWVAPIKITPNGAPLGLFDPPLVTADCQGKVWFAWLEDHPVNRWYVLARYHENASLSEPDTVMPEYLVMILRGLTRDKYGNIWVLGDNDQDIWTRYYDGNQWSDTMRVPVFPSANFGATAGADSLGNYWVAWSTDWFGYRSIHSRYYDGSVWSTNIPVSDKPGDDCSACGIATAQNGVLWLPWRCSIGFDDSLYVSTYDGSEWRTDFVLGGNIRLQYPHAFIASSLTDSSVLISYRKESGFIYVLRLLSPTLAPETIWVNSEFETPPVMACDDLGRMWLFFCDSIGHFDQRVYYSVWDGDSVTTPCLLDTLEAHDPRTTFDPYHRRVWVSYKSYREGPHAIYATYVDVQGICEDKEVVQQCISLICTPNPANNNVAIKYTLPSKVRMSLELYDNVGRLVQVICRGECAPGFYSRTICLSDCPSGVYFLLLKTGGSATSRKLVYIRQ